MATNLLFFCLHVNQPSLPYFHFKILLYFVHVDKAKRANYHVNKRIINWLPFGNKVYGGLKFRAHRRHLFFKLTAAQVLVFRLDRRLEPDYFIVIRSSAFRHGNIYVLTP